MAFREMKAKIGNNYSVSLICHKTVAHNLLI